VAGGSDDNPMMAAEATPWGRVLAEVYAFVQRNPRSNRAVVAAADVAPGHRVLDIGCGPGAAVRDAARTVELAVGVDNSPAVVAIARRRSKGLGNVRFEVAPAEDLPFEDEFFDRVWSIHARHHWADPPRGLAEAVRVLRPGGLLLIAERRSRGAHGLTREGAEDLASEFARAGLVDQRIMELGKELVVTGSRPG